MMMLCNHSRVDVVMVVMMMLCSVVMMMLCRVVVDVVVETVLASSLSSTVTTSHPPPVLLPQSLLSVFCECFVVIPFTPAVLSRDHCVVLTVLLLLTCDTSAVSAAPHCVQSEEATVSRGGRTVHRTEALSCQRLSELSLVGIVLLPRQGGLSS